MMNLVCADRTQPHLIVGTKKKTPVKMKVREKRIEIYVTKMLVL